MSIVDGSGRRIAVACAQILVVIAATVAYAHFGESRSMLIVFAAVAAIICISAIPVRSTFLRSKTKSGQNM